MNIDIDKKSERVIEKYISEHIELAIQALKAYRAICDLSNKIECDYQWKILSMLKRCRMSVDNGMKECVDFNEPEMFFEVNDRDYYIEKAIDIITGKIQ